MCVIYRCSSVHRFEYVDRLDNAEGERPSSSSGPSWSIMVRRGRLAELVMTGRKRSIAWCDRYISRTKESRPPAPLSHPTRSDLGQEAKSVPKKK